MSVLVPDSTGRVYRPLGCSASSHGSNFSFRHIRIKNAHLVRIMKMV